MRTSITERLLPALGAALLLAGCYPSHQGPNWEVTQRQVSFDELDRAMVGSAPPVADAVTGERIARARSEPHNWLTYYGAYDGQRFSSLSQINASNVSRLRPAWQFQVAPLGLLAAPATYSFEAAPIVVDGVMFVSGWDGYVWAFDAATGKELWRYQHAVPLDIPLCCGNVNRGVAVARGRVFYSSPDGVLYALDARTGEPVWKKTWLDPRAGESSTMAPLVVKNLVIVGSSGAEYGVRGHIDAYDIDTGRRVWRRYPVPRPGEPGSETWGGDPKAWEHGGGSAWITGTYDPELDLLYWGTSNPSPDLDGRKRPGSNLYTDSVLAMDPDDGTVRWHYQWTPHDVWDYSGVNENILFEEGGRRLLAHFDKNGYLFILDRATGQRVSVTPFADRITWGRIDASGAAKAERIPTREGTEICPGPAGAKEWTHATYSADTKLLYTPVIDACATYRMFETPMKESLSHWGGDYTVAPEQVRGGGVKAYRTNGTLAWEWRSDEPIVASLLSTAGGLVFVGTPTGEFIALDARNGRQLWQFRTGSGIHSSPISYSVGGTQYIAVPTGWGGWIKGFAPRTFGHERGSTLFVFALPDAAPAQTAQSSAGTSR